MQVSVVVITLNEAANIGRCLASVQGVADEVIVLDSGSSDNTCALAEAAGASVHTQPWAGYAAQKNAANALAKGPYILSLDADEALSPKLYDNLLALRNAGLRGAYRFNRATNYCGTWVKHGGWYPDAKVRLFPKEGSCWIGDHVHETLELDPALAITQLPGDLLHWSYRDRADHLERIERYSSLHAQKMFEAGKHATWVKRHLSPIAKFVQGYLFQAGFLDGQAGWWIAVLSAQAVRMKYAKLHAMQHGDPA